MAKETRLNDDADIYQPRDNRSEKEKFKSMDRKQKIQYFNQYYRTKTIAIIAGIVCIGYLLYSMFGPKVKISLDVAILDGCVDTEVAKLYEDDMIKQLELNKKKNTVNIDDTYYVTDKSEYSASNQQKLVVYIAAAEIDVMIAPEDVFKKYADSGYFLKMSDTLPTQLFSSLTDNFYYDQAEDDTQEAAYGIYLNSSDDTSKTVVGILSNTKHNENAISFIEYLKDQNQLSTPNK